MSPPRFPARLAASTRSDLIITRPARRVPHAPRPRLEERTSTYASQDACAYASFLWCGARSWPILGPRYARRPQRRDIYRQITGAGMHAKPALGSSGCWNRTPRKGALVLICPSRRSLHVSTDARHAPHVCLPWSLPQTAHASTPKLAPALGAPTPCTARGRGAVGHDATSRRFSTHRLYGLGTSEPPCVRTRRMERTHRLGPW